jgi:hypothetical protein
MLTKTEVSDLKTHIDRVVRTALEEQTASMIHSHAKDKLIDFLWHQEFDNKPETASVKEQP